MKLMIFLIGVVFAMILGILEFESDYAYEKSVGSYWELSEKASTLQQKSTYLDQYVTSIETPGWFASNAAVIFPTPNTSFAQNLVALKSLQGRMHQIASMDETSFAYQTAIQQITAQEQGEGGAMIGTFESCWYLNNWPLLWGWHDFLAWLFLVVVPIGFATLWELIDLSRA
jgi:hypothetical protein